MTSWTDRQAGVFWQGLARAARAAGDLIVPPACLACARPLASSENLCAACWRDIHFISAPLCDRLGIPLPYDPGGTVISARALADPPDYDRARAVAEHTGTIRRMVAMFKYHDRLEMRALFGRWMMMAGRQLIDESDVILPVPLHRVRLWTRQFNQAAILAKELGRLSGKPVAYEVLLRSRRTPQQVTLSPSERLRNPRGAFAVAKRNAGLIDGRRVLLIDDVLTTGATVNACARTLRSAGASGVDVLTVTLATNRPDTDILI